VNAAGNVVELIRTAVRSFATSVLLRELRPDGDGVAREVTYGGLHETSQRIAASLLNRRVVKGDRIAVLLENRIELVATEWACLFSGVVWVGLNVRTSTAELAEILDDSRPRMFLYSSLSALTAEAVSLPPGCERLSVDAADWGRLLAEGEAALSRGFQPNSPSSEDPVRIRYTSGTAGRAKGAVLPRRSYDASVEVVSRVIGPLAPDDVVVQVAPMTHASGAMLLPHAFTGAKAVVLHKFDPDVLIEVIEKHRATAVFLVPTMLVRLLEALDGSRRVTTLRTIVYGGASMPVQRLRCGIDRLGPVFVQIYGLTESTWPICALLREDHVRRPKEYEAQWLERLHSCGRPTEVGELTIVDPHGSPVAVREVGEIHVRGRNTMLGYWRNPEAAEVSDVKGLDPDGWMHTGDLGFADEEGFVTIVDRLHDMIVSGGFNVYPTEVESALFRHPAVLEAVVVGRPHHEWGETVHATVVLRPGAVTDAEAIAAHCAAILPGYKKPRSVEFVDSLPKNASGKVVRRVIRDRLRAIHGPEGSREGDPSGRFHKRD
jgi:acyl-CoA synthetase (AMP-forming)/AMP-acid ligase II